MPGSVAVPEKTIEHWSSQYITFRYRTKAMLWWPASGEDIDLRDLPARPGKAVQFELKTATTAGPHTYDVLVDLGQLWDYVHSPSGRQPFYAFPGPQPGWDGSLTKVATAGGRVVPELGFSRSRRLWFANWMIVLTAAQVATVLAPELKGHGSRARGQRERLVRFHRGIPAWGPGGGVPNPGALSWRKFWLELERCGRAGWHQLIHMPVWLVEADRQYSSSQLIGLLREVANTPEFNRASARQFVTLEPDEEGSYQVIRDAPGILSEPRRDGRSGEDRNDETSDHRMAVFLDARSLQSRP